MDSAMWQKVSHPTLFDIVLSLFTPEQALTRRHSPVQSTCILFLDERKGDSLQAF